ncbi:DUF6037 family protein [Priestia sp. LL-8]|uniref:DUF6037 family protein n=1 Tax=Priestia sp. LL-8 TaxID=3110068 RepID=UPI002E2678BD|nr:DUF6037 family protein [Priestia sp. LL-8]
MSKQKAPLENLKVIRDELKERNWAVDAFLFQYKKQEYVVLVKVYSDREKKESTYAIVKLEFIKKRHKNENFCTYADLYKIHIPDMKSFREFFGIEYKENLGDVIQQFTQYFSTFIPNQLMANKETSLKNSITEYLNKTDSESSTGIYCIGVKRNGIKKDGTSGKRSPENNQKAALLKPELFNKLMDDTTISFCFSEDPTRENTDEDILLRWAERNNNL